MLFLETDDLFQRKTDETLKDSIIWGSCLSVLAIVLGYIAWKFGVKKILSLEHERKYLLRIFPVRAILMNRFIRAYLIENTKGYGSRLK